jgi:phosphate transport system protein
MGIERSQRPIEGFGSEPAEKPDGRRLAEDTGMEQGGQVGKGEAVTRSPAGTHVSHSRRDQDALWAEFLAMAQAVVDSLAKSVDVLCENRLEAVAEVKKLEKASDRAELRIEQACLRVLALFEPVASDLRRMATIFRVTRDWERIADLARRIARRARKLARSPNGVRVPERLKSLARDVLAQVRAVHDVQTTRDANRARDVVEGDRHIDREYRQVQRELKESLCQQPVRLEGWLQLMSTARNLERIADHATGIAQAIVYLREGVIIRHKIDRPTADE